MSLLQLADGFGDVDEVVGNTLGVLGKGDILCSGLRFADSHIYKTDDHHSNGTTTLDSSGADSADCHAEPFFRPA